MWRSATSLTQALPAKEEPGKQISPKWEKNRNKDLLNWGSISYFSELLILFYYFFRTHVVIDPVVCPEEGTPKR